MDESDLAVLPADSYRHVADIQPFHARGKKDDVARSDLSLDARNLIFRNVDERQPAQPRFHLIPDDPQVLGSHGILAGISQGGV